MGPSSDAALTETAMTLAQASPFTLKEVTESLLTAAGLRVERDALAAEVRELRAQLAATGTCDEAHDWPDVWGPCILPVGHSGRHRSRSTRPGTSTRHTWGWRR